MRIRLCSIAAAALLVCGLCLPVAAAQPGRDELTGREWVESTQNEKLAFLYGVSSVVAIEEMIAQKAGKQPSIFVQAWSKAFKDTPWMDIAAKVNEWYATHPDQRQAQVFEVLWTNYLAPALKK